MALQPVPDVEEVKAKLNSAALDTKVHDGIADHTAPATADADQQETDSDLTTKIVRQVNFYFSDTNLPTDIFLLKEVRKTPEGWVPVRLIAGFKRMKSLTKDIKIIVAALETSSELVLSGHRVRRKLPLPVVDEAEVLMRTVIVENLPDQATIDSLTKKFSAAGHVKMVRICQPNSGPRSIAQTIPGADLAVSRQQHALIEFDTQDEAAVAVKKLTDSNNWRSGLRVRPLLRRGFQLQQQLARSQASRQQAQHQQAAAHELQKQQQHQQHTQTSSEGQNKSQHQSNDQNIQQASSQQAISQQAICQQAISQQAQAQPPSAQQADTSALLSADSAPFNDHAQSNGSTSQSAERTEQQSKGGKAAGKGQKGKRTKKDYAAWAGATAETRAAATAHLEGNPDAAEGPPSAHAASKGLAVAPGSSQPKMPDGSRGFAMGRGRAL